MKKSKEKLLMAGVMIPETEKIRLQEVAKRRGITLTDLLLNGGRMLANFPDAFLDQIQAVSESTRLSFSQVLTQLLLTYAAEDAATLKVFGKSQTYSRAFRINNRGVLLTGDKLSDEVYAEVLKSAQDLKKRLEDSAHGKPEPIIISNEDAAAMAVQMTQIPATM
jgi:hypothetical protein